MIIRLRENASIMNVQPRRSHLPSRFWRCLRDNYKMDGREDPSWFHYPSVKLIWALLWPAANFESLCSFFFLTLVCWKLMATWTLSDPGHDVIQSGYCQPMCVCVCVNRSRTTSLITANESAGSRVKCLNGISCCGAFPHRCITLQHITGPFNDAMIWLHDYFVHQWLTRDKYLPLNIHHF